MKKHLLLSTALWLSIFCSFAQEKEQVTNAFLDLQRSGEFKSHISEMQTPASKEEINTLLKEKPQCGYFLFTEERAFDIVMKDLLPERWVKRSKKNRMVLNTICQPNEFFTYQIGIFSPFQTLNNIKLEFSNLKNSSGSIIPSKNMQCFNLGGVNSLGLKFNKKVSVLENQVQPLWIGVQIPTTAKGLYKGTVTVSGQNARPQQITICLEVKGEQLVKGGENDGWRKGRLKWLNSIIGNGAYPTKPYTPLQLKKQIISYLGGNIQLGSEGLPKAITTHYDESNQLSSSVKNEVLDDAMRFIIETSKGIEKLVPSAIKVVQQSATKISWKCLSRNNNLTLTVEGTFNFDGFCHYSCQVHSNTNIEIKDIRLEVPYSKNSSEYMMGLGHRGGYRPKGDINWKWNIDNHQDKIWMGAINAGLNLTFMDENYVRPLVNVYYALGKLKLPTSWGNTNKGGIHLQEKEHHTMLTAYSGERLLKKGETLFYNFNLLITPVKPLNLNQLASVKFYHSNSDVSSVYIPEALKAGATAINIHHKKDIYPFINYPYYDESTPYLKSFTKEAHAKGLKVRVYYTTRELTVKLPELWALRSLGSEIIHDGAGKDARTPIHEKGPHEWLCKNLKDHFIPAWYNAFNEGRYKGDMDLSVITTPDSRWNNYYLEGLNWMIKHIGIDGIYIDDSALDRETIQRARRILDADEKERLIDMHSWNHLNSWAGNANSIHLYMELLPYVNRMWLGEGFGGDNPADFWLIEVSGIPFGLMSETLEQNNLMRGMAFGMLPRLPWSGNPKPMWKVWDKFGMKDATYIGYWDSRNFISCESKEVKASLFKNNKTGQTLVVLSNWSNNEQSAAFKINTPKAYACQFKVSPCIIEGIQDGTEIETLKPQGGAIFIIDQK